MTNNIKYVSQTYLSFHSILNFVKVSFRIYKYIYIFVFHYKYKIKSYIIIQIIEKFIKTDFIFSLKFLISLFK